MNLKECVRGLLHKYNHTQRGVAQIMRIDEGQMSRLLDSSPRPVTLDALCEAIGCNADERLEVYRHAGKMPPEIVNAFCDSLFMARAIRNMVKRGEGMLTGVDIHGR